MFKDVDFTAIVSKMAFLVMLFVIGSSISIWTAFDGKSRFIIGWLILLVIGTLICCFKATRAAAETEDTRRVTEFLFRLWGMFRCVQYLTLVPYSLLAATEGAAPAMKELFVQMKVVIQANPMQLFPFVICLTLLFVPGIWNRLILLIGTGIRRVVEKDRRG